VICYRPSARSTRFRGVADFLHRFLTAALDLPDFFASYRYFVILATCYASPIFVLRPRLVCFFAILLSPWFDVTREKHRSLPCRDRGGGWPESREMTSLYRKGCKDKCHD